MNSLFDGLHSLRSSSTNKIQDFTLPFETCSYVVQENLVHLQTARNPQTINAAKIRL